MHGVVESVTTAVSQAGALVTTVKGLELAGHALLNTTVDFDRQDTVPRDQVIADILTAAKLPPARGTVGGDVQNFTLHSDGLGALRELTRQAGAPLVVQDGAVLVGSGVGAEEFGTLSADRHIVSLERRQEAQVKHDPAAKPGATPKHDDLAVLDLELLGLPDLRVGQAVRIEPRDAADAISVPLRVHQLAHRFSVDRGYTCSATVVAADVGAPVEASRGAHRLVQWVRETAAAAGQERPAIDVGQVRDYQDGTAGKHEATLTYGQSPPADAVAPSVEQPVNDQPVLHAKPIASPFAWDRCGLVVPVYPTMRAVLAHNRGLVNDAVVTGFLWAENPQHRRPQSKPGDYWLCLPTKITNDVPEGEAANDLTSADGLRVIEVKGLRIVVGNGNRTEVGTRPAPPKERMVVIEHDSKTSITITDSGAVEIKTADKDITISAGAGKVTLEAKTVEVK